MSGYIGTQPVPQATQTRDSFTATSGQTSFATGGYTPNFLDVYLNGVKLASADYTATNGSDVVLASGAATGDILEVVAFTTFNSASSSIDDNGNATAITIDSSENVMVGTTDPLVADGTNGGIVLGGQRDLLHVSRVNQPPVKFSRANNDGDIAIFAKDGTSVGSIGTKSGSLLIGSNDTYLRVNDPSDTIFPSNSSGVERDNTINLGKSSSRFKDLYLSGGIYLGGTGSANKLDDYETGTFTPSVISGWTAVTYNNQSGTYTKVGRLVHFQITLTANAGNRTANGNRFDIGGLPFVKTGSGASVSVWSDLWSMGGSNNTANGLIGSQTIEFYQSNYASGGENTLTGTEMNSGSGNELYISGTYEAT